MQRWFVEFKEDCSLTLVKVLSVDTLPNHLKEKLNVARADIKKRYTTEFPYDESKYECEEIKHKNEDRILGYYLSTGSSRNGPVILCIHGGGFTYGKAVDFRGWYARLGVDANTDVFLVEYQLCPEQAFPKNVEDCVAAYEYLIKDRSIPNEEVAIIGHSAGGGLVALLLNALQGRGKIHPRNPNPTYFTCDARLHYPAGAVICSPWMDFDLQLESYTTNEGKDPVLKAFFADPFPELIPYFFLGNNQTSVSASPFYLNAEGWECPVRVTVGSIEPCLDDAAIFAENAKTVGVKVTYQCYKDMPHNGSNPLNDPETKKICDTFWNDNVQFLRSLFK